MLKRSQKDVSDSSKHWYQDKYQQVLTQRNLLALLAVVALLVAAVAVLALMRMAPLKTVVPYLLTIDEKTGITARVDPVTREKYAANEAVDRYFTAMYLRLREGYNPVTLRNSYDTIRLMTARDIFSTYVATLDSNNPESLTKRLGGSGMRDIKIRSMAYLPNAISDGQSKTMQARIAATETGIEGALSKSQYFVITITFQYAQLELNEEERWMNPLGYTVVRYQVQPEIE